jgi:hypothetical protein
MTDHGNLMGWLGIHTYPSAGCWLTGEYVVLYVEDYSCQGNC